MSSDDATPLPPASQVEAQADALAQEVRQLRALLGELQVELGGGVQSSLRERSAELQRMGGELHERQAESERLRLDLEAALRRSQDLEREIERWQGAATRGVEEIAEKHRAATERFEAQSQALEAALAGLRAQLEASRAQAQGAADARDGALKELERTRRRARTLKARVLRRERGRIEMTRSLSWRITAPLRWIPRALHQLALGGARLRRRMLKKKR